ncbi:hypothetical protein GRF59_09710 [Paenibacillus sp. HJL G12]|uniref:DNA helicase n=1 Tax=Paenibacillus dendrobii TaxID=2691084 RepID=A0A7X3LH60_9BACL|nr:hypothetical protein [Paenibacillus dendrobii]MWV43910.1 hypothetical protein [Paenibacillus dendrobii]
MTNQIIRDETSKELIIQGVAGSGNLHRIAFLLYRYKDTLTSSNVLILSPNKVFSDYISNVLPELGEKKIMEAGMEVLAAKELAGICRFQTFYEQVAELLEGQHTESAERIRYKARLELIQELDSFAEYAEMHFFEARDIVLENVFIAKEDMLKKYHSLEGTPVKPRLEKIASLICRQARSHDGESIPPAAAKKNQDGHQKYVQVPKRAQPV